MEDYAAAENLTNSTFARDILPGQTTFFLVNDIIFTILCVIGMCVDTTIIYTLMHYKKMQTVYNSFIVNWAIADLCALVVIPSKYRIFEIIEGAPISFLLSAFLFQIEYILQDAILLFVATLAVDWCLASYFPTASEKFRKYYKLVIGLIWSLALLSLCVSLGLSIDGLFFHIPVVFIFFGYLALLIFVIGLQLSRVVQKCRNKTCDYPTLTLTLPTLFVICWVPIWLSVVLKDLMVKYLFLLLEFSILSSPLTIFITLYRYSQHFQKCFHQAMRFSNIRYVDSISETSDSSENVYDTSDIRVHFHPNCRNEQ